jgi:hypothetical protein
MSARLFFPSGRFAEFIPSGGPFGELLPAAVVVGLAAVGCSGSLKFDNTQPFRLTLSSPAEIDVCAALLLPRVDAGNVELPTRSTIVALPANPTGQMSSPDEDVWSFQPNFTAANIVGVVPFFSFTFDSGPIGTFYGPTITSTFGSASTLVGNAAVDGVAGFQVAVESTVVGGSQESDREVNVTVEHRFGCDTVKVGDETCSCATVVVDFNAKSGV